MEQTLCVPPEILKMILGYLSNEDLCSVLLVSKDWNRWAEEVWDCNILYAIGPKDVEVFRWNRLKRVTCVRLDSLDKWTDDLFEQLLELPKLEKIEFHNFKMNPSFSYRSMKKLLPRLEELSVFEDSLSMREIFLVLGFLEVCNMKKIELNRNNLIDIPCDIFGNVINSIEEFTISNSKTRGDQWANLFLKMVHETRNLKSLNVEGLLNVEWSFCDFKEIDPLKVGKALNQLESLSLNEWKYKFSKSQLDVFFECLSKETSLTCLSLQFFDLRSVDDETLAKALIKIEDLQLLDCRLTKSQAEEIFQLMCSNGSVVRKLDIRGSKDFSSIDHKIFAKTIGDLDQAMIFCEDSDSIDEEEQ